MNNYLLFKIIPDDLLEIAQNSGASISTCVCFTLPFVNSMMTKIPKAINAQGSVNIIGSI